MMSYLLQLIQHITHNRTIVVSMTNVLDFKKTLIQFTFKQSKRKGISES